MSVPRIASVDYLNARPLTRGFTHGPYVGLYPLTQTSPALCADLLLSGEASIGLIPSIEFQRIPGVRILPQACIASRTRARSVLLVSKVAAPEIRRVAVDSSSRTSAALLRILLDRRARSRVEYLQVAPDLRAMLEESDAALIIGDAALKADTEGYRVYDLASEWFEMTGLPFVFAFWAVRPDVVLVDGFRPFIASRKIGLESIDEIAAEESRNLGLPEALLSEYLRVNIAYNLGTEEIRSLWLFYRLAREGGIIPTLREVSFYEPAATRAGLAEVGGVQ